VQRAVRCGATRGWSGCAPALSVGRDVKSGRNALPPVPDPNTSSPTPFLSPAPPPPLAPRDGQIDPAYYAQLTQRARALLAERHTVKKLQLRLERGAAAALALGGGGAADLGVRGTLTEVGEDAPGAEAGGAPSFVQRV